LLNPFGGKGKAKEVWRSVKDMFEIAAIQTTVIGK
jgi:hypothetical protein